MGQKLRVQAYIEILTFINECSDTWYGATHLGLVGFSLFLARINHGES